MIENKKEAGELILNSRRNIMLYGGEESLDLLLEQRRLNRQTIVCAGTERLAVIKECVYLNGFLDSDENTVKNCIQCSDLMVIYGADLISAAALDLVAELRKKYNAGLRLILVGDVKTQLVCAATGFTSVDTAECWQELDLVEIDARPPREDRDFQAYLDAFRNGIKSALGKVDQCFKAYESVENCVVLCTAEHSAETFNEKIIGKEDFKGNFEATIEGDFPESAYPVPKVLTVIKDMPVLMVNSGIYDVNQLFKWKDESSKIYPPTMDIVLQTAKSCYVKGRMLLKDEKLKSPKERRKHLAKLLTRFYTVPKEIAEHILGSVEDEEYSALYFGLTDLHRRHKDSFAVVLTLLMKPEFYDYVLRLITE